MEWRERGGFVSYFLAWAGKGRVEDSGVGETVGSFGSAGWRISGDAGLDGALDGGVGLFRIGWMVARPEVGLDRTDPPIAQISADS